MTILRFSYRLLIKETFSLPTTLDRFFISDLWLTDIGGNLKLPEKPVNDNVEMKFAHP